MRTGFSIPRPADRTARAEFRSQNPRDGARHVPRIPGAPASRGRALRPMQPGLTGVPRGEQPAPRP
jgi:hypothetical protein